MSLSRAWQLSQDRRINNALNLIVHPMMLKTQTHHQLFLERYRRNPITLAALERTLCPVPDQTRAPIAQEVFWICFRHSIGILKETCTIVVAAGTLALVLCFSECEVRHPVIWPPLALTKAEPASKKRCLTEINPSNWVINRLTTFSDYLHPKWAISLLNMYESAVKHWPGHFPEIQWHCVMCWMVAMAVGHLSRRQAGPACNVQHLKYRSIG